MAWLSVIVLLLSATVPPTGFNRAPPSPTPALVPFPQTLELFRRRRNRCVRGQSRQTRWQRSPADPRHTAQAQSTHSSPPPYIPHPPAYPPRCRRLGTLPPQRPPQPPATVRS